MNYPTMILSVLDITGVSFQEKIKIVCETRDVRPHCASFTHVRPLLQYVHNLIAELFSVAELMLCIPCVINNAHSS